ncbi:MAG: hypothetical protein QM737_21310 [Ferruginibacter sp.]
MTKNQLPFHIVVGGDTNRGDFPWSVSSLTILKKSVFLLLMLFSFSCKKNNESASSRNFYMGVTPWPAAYSTDAVNQSYAFINDHCDIVSHHFDEGIPYEEAFNNSAMPARLQQDVLDRKTKTQQGKKILLSVAALSITRTQKAPYSTLADNVPDSIKTKWSQLAFNDAKVVTAYVNFISYLADQLNPVYINYGVESNCQDWTAADFILYKDFLSKVYQQLKTSHPSIPLFVSFIVSEDARALSYASQLVEYTDFLALSAYPYTSVSSSANGNTDPSLFPADYFTRFTNLAPGKPFGFAETGYAAENLVIPSFNLNKQCTPAWQDAYLQMILKFCNERDSRFLIWFCHEDYDKLADYFMQNGLYIDLMGLWRDTGLTDENGVQRPAYNTWLGWQAKQKNN